MELNELKKKFNIQEGENVSLDVFAGILNSVNKGEISKEELGILLQSLPNLVELQKSILDAARKVSESAKET